MEKNVFKAMFLTVFLNPLKNKGNSWRPKQRTITTGGVTSAGEWTKEHLQISYGIEISLNKTLGISDKNHLFSKICKISTAN